MSLEAKLWREVSQHVQLDESIERIVEILRAELPVWGIALRRLIRESSSLMTVSAVAVPGWTLDPVAIGKRAVAARLSELSSWLERGAPRWLASDTLLGVTPQSGAAIGVPLRIGGKADAMALLFVEASAASDALLDRVGAIAGPLGVALENDQRLHDLTRMRESLEADRNTLLSSLQRQDFSEVIIGEAGGLREVSASVEQVAPTDAPVLILGETGAGKEVIARALHSRSHRANGPIVRINCGAIPPDLVDSELFGHERGAFTGAVSVRKGWFERADGGTLFLDEIGELPAAAQVRLLRVLQEGTLERVGGHQTISVDVRIVAATHRRLELMVAQGLFREDLWYRLNVFPIFLPALRERREDIPALASHFAKHAGRRLGGMHLTPSADDLDLLQDYSWPGNVRELAAVIERAAILGGGKRLDLKGALGATAIPSVLPRAHSPSEPPLGRATRPGATAPLAGGDQRAFEVPPASSERSFLTLEQAMAQHIERALRICHGRIEGSRGAAELLDINPHTLRARMRKLGLDWSKFR